MIEKLLFGLVLAFLPAAAFSDQARPAVPATETAVATQSERSIPRPAIWLLADEDTRIYLFGTILVLPPETRWRSPQLDQIVAEADELVHHLREDPEDDSEFIAPWMMRRSRVPILSRVSRERREPLRNMLDALDVTVEAMDHWQTWWAAHAISLDAVSLVHGRDPSYRWSDDPDRLTRVEDELLGDFTRTGRPISAVQTMTEIFRSLSQLPERSQREMLDSVVDAYRRGELPRRPLGPRQPSKEAWISGNIEQIGAEMEWSSPELFDVMIKRPNAELTRWLIKRLERPGTLLFAVGAGHLAGRGSVQSMLEAEGFRITRLN